MKTQEGIVKTQEEIKNKLAKGTKENYQVTLMLVGISLLLAGFSIWAQTLEPERLSSISSPSNFLIFYGILLGVIGATANWRHFKLFLKILLWVLVVLLVIAILIVVLSTLSLWPF
jgi:uncharacterized membrane protein